MKLPRKAQPLAEGLCEELDALTAVQCEAKKAMPAEAKKHPQYRLEKTCPGLKGAATTVIGRGKDEPIYRHYCRLLDGGTKPNLVKLTVARQIASIVLAVWRTEEVYDPDRLERIS